MMMMMFCGCIPGTSISSGIAKVEKGGRPPQVAIRRGGKNQGDDKSKNGGKNGKMGAIRRHQASCNVWGGKIAVCPRRR